MPLKSFSQTVSALLSGRSPHTRISKAGAFALSASVALATVLGAAKTADAQSLVQVPVISTFAGTGSLTTTSGGDGGQATAAGLNNPEGIAYDNLGNTYIADYNNDTIRIVSPAGIMNTFAGQTGVPCTNSSAASNPCGDGLPISNAAVKFFLPTEMRTDAAGNLYIADFQDFRIRKISINPATGRLDSGSIITTVAGNGIQGTSGNGGVATSGELTNPHGIALSPSGDLYIADQQGDCDIRYVPATNKTVYLGTTATNVTAGHIYAYAGSGSCGGSPGANGNATATGLSSPTGITLDASLNLYIADEGNSDVRKVTYSTGVMTTVAGNSSGGCPVTGPSSALTPAPSCGDGGAATSASLNAPTGVYIDAAGNLIIGDGFGARVRKVIAANGVLSNSSIITTIAGTSQQCTNISQTSTYNGGPALLNYPNCGDGGIATSALVSFPILVSVNSAGNILYVDQYDNKVRQIQNSIQFPNTKVGSQSPAQNVLLAVTGSPLTIGTISVPTSPSGVPQYVIKSNSCATGTSLAVGTICTLSISFLPSFPGPQNAPLLAVTSGGTFQFGLSGTGVGPQAVLLPGNLSTVAGIGSEGAALPGADTPVTPGDIAGFAYSGDGGLASAAIVSPRTIAFDASGNYYIADSYHNVVRFVNAQTGIISTVAGKVTTASGVETAVPCNSSTNSCGDGGLATNAQLSDITCVAVDAAGNLYICDGADYRVREVSASTGIITTIAGNGSNPNPIVPGTATSVGIGQPADVKITSSGNLYILTWSAPAQLLYLNTGSGQLSVIANSTGAACPNPTAASGACGDGGSAYSATLSGTPYMAIDSTGDIYIADDLANRIRRIDANTGIISTVAGNGTAGYTGDGGLATAAEVGSPRGVAVDAAGDLFISDTGNHAVRFVNAATKIISTIAGNGTACSAPTGACGDGSPANGGAYLNAPDQTVLDPSGNLYISDFGSQYKVRKINSAALTLQFASEQVGTAAPQLTGTLANIGNATLNFTPTGNATFNPLVSTTGPTAAASKAFSYLPTGSSQCPNITGASTATLAAGASCLYTAEFTPDTVTGNYTGTLVETDDSLNAGDTGNLLFTTPATQTITLLGTASKSSISSIAVASSVNPSALGQSVTFTATVTTPAAAATGTIYFYSGATQIGTGALSTTAGVTTATLSTSTLPASATTITAIYGGDTTYTGDTGGTYPDTVAGTSATLSQTVNPEASTGDKLTAVPSAITLAGTPNSTTLTYLIPVAGGFTTAPTGTVTFTYPTSAGATAGTGTGTFTGAQQTITGVTYWTAVLAGVTDLPGGVQTVTGMYPGDSNYAFGTETAQVTVTGEAGTGDLVTATPSTIVLGGTPSSTTLAYLIPVVSGFNTPPSKTVTFTYPTSAGATAGSGTATFSATPVTVSGVSYWQAQLTGVTGLPGGTDTVSGSYPAGDPNYQAATATAQVTVTGEPNTGYKLTATPSTIILGGTPNSTALAYLIPVVSGFTTAPSKTVTFTYPTSAGATAGTGTATFSSTPVTVGGVQYWSASLPGVTNLPGGTDTVSGSYPAGDPNYQAGTATTQITVTGEPSTGDKLTATPSTIVLGGTPNSTTLAYLIPVVSGFTTAPTKTVTFTYPTSAGATAGTGTATFSSTPVTVGGVQYWSASLAGISNLPGGTDTVSGSYPTGDPNYQAGTATTQVTVTGEPSTGDQFFANPASITIGGTTSLVFEIPAVTGFTTAPSLPVTFTYPTSAGATAGTGTATFTGPVTVSGASYWQATLANVSGLPVGTQTATATYPTGDPNYQTGTLTTAITVGQSTGAPVLTTNNPSPTVGQPVTFTATIPLVGGVAPTCPVTFLNGTTPIGTGTVNAQGIATLTISTLPLGSDVITASLPSCGNYAPGTSNPITETVGQSSVPPVLTTSNPAPTVGQPVTFTAMIPVIGGVPPTCPITFYNGTTAIGTGTVNAQGIATLTLSSLPVGTDTITASLPNCGNYGPVTSNPVTETVGQSSVPPVLTTSNPAPTVGQPVTFTATIPVIGGVPPTCPITFYNGTTAIGTGTVNAQGIATLTISSLPVGTDIITASLPNCGNYGPVTSNPVTETVGQSTGPDVLTSSNLTPTAGGAPVTFTDTIPLVNGVAPTCPVTFYSNGTAIGTGTVNAQGVATFTYGGLAAGTDNITAVLPNCGNYAQTTSNTVVETVAPGTPTDTLTCSPNPSSVAQPVNCTDTIGTIDNVPATCPVQFYDNGVAIGSPVIPVNGVATFSYSNLPAGNNVITAVMQACGNYGNTTSNPITQIVGLNTPNDVLTSNNTNPTFGTAVTFTDTITLLNGVAPAGPVTFYNGAVAIGTGTPTATPGVYTFTTSKLGVGSDPITAVLSADSTYAQTTSNTVIELITKGGLSGPGDVLTSSNTTPLINQPVTFTNTLTLINGVVPVGPVTLYNGSTSLGVMTPTAIAGVYTLTTSALPSGVDSITAVLTADANYQQSTSNIVIETVANPDFSITATPASQTINPGYSASYQVSLSGVSAAFTSPVTLTATGLPPSATVSFAKATLVPGTGPTSTTMTIVTSPDVAAVKPAETGGKIFYGLLLLPLLGLRKIRRKIKALPGGIAYLLMLGALLGGLGATIGCGGGYFGGPPQTYTITVTGTSGTLTHSTTVTLTVR